MAFSRSPSLAGQMADAALFDSLGDGLAVGRRQTPEKSRVGLSSESYKLIYGQPSGTDALSEHHGNGACQIMRRHGRWIASVE